ncbi:MAG: M10 family metallopeptidase domain-containing protein [candidate division KSB1 bacterium]|nr:M10 family metallopeptidase domain-containing protein [candidate division KSB1 bacterium]MDZ7367441.1 M10 family metallopeptidase domain-containing protein [candidate division KSB1 bacterium]MDZ7405454.1 M10 family metallopeptidase domain-containing protein [candidate division KSB1 bacterium]
MKKIFCSALVLILFAWGCQKENPTTPKLEPTDQKNQLLQKVNAINESLASKRFSLGKTGGSSQTVGIFLNEIYPISMDSPFFDVIVLSVSRWVANDARRNASGDRLTYMVDPRFGATASGLSANQTTNAINASISVHNDFLSSQTALNLRSRGFRGADPTIFDELFGLDPDGNQGNGFPFFADFTQAGFYSGSYFDALFGPGGKENVLAFTAAFIFINPSTGAPTDIDGNGRLDRALAEVYYNNFFGTPGGSRAGFPWGINVNLPGIDVQTVAQHENGHSLDLGHIVNPACPGGLMEPFYNGLLQQNDPCTKANLFVEYRTWPNP